jgi:type IV pilus assembly protein PilY1
MIRKHLTVAMAILVGAIAMAFSYGARAQAPTTNDDFTQAHDTNSWQTFDGACLTAGDGTGSIPACAGLAYYQNQIQVGGNSGWLGLSSAPATGAGQAGDPPGKGALRFTNGHTPGSPGTFQFGYKQAGSIISSGTPYPTGSGLQVIFKTVTYHGDSGGTCDGADGMGFFLMDGSLSPYDTGAFGGSLGYTCSNETFNYDPTLRADGTVRGYDGLAGGYIGLGIDEYGNFLNAGDNTASGFGYVPGRIGLRGSGSISFAALHALNSTYYPSSLLTTTDSTYVTKAAAAVHNTCSTGYLWDYSRSSRPEKTSTAVNDYTAIPGAYTILSTLLPGKHIANEGAATRGDATPLTYNLKITQDGILSLYVSYGGGAYLPVITKQSITASNGSLPSSFRFGFTGSTGGSTNIHELLCFQTAPADVAGTSVGVNAQEAAKIASGTQAYLAFYYPSGWTGRLTANNLLYSAATQSISISPTSNWDASCNLTGVANLKTCPTTLAAGPIAAQSPTSPGRTMLTWNGSKGVAFEWNASTSGSAISSTQQTTLDQGDSSNTANRLNYLRGDRTNEINTLGVGLYRARDGVLGDIIDSSPTWVGPPTSHYTAAWKDLLVSGDLTPENTGTQNFNQYLAAEKTRLNVVYDGANDGFLHAFESGAFDSGGNYVNNSTYPNDGKEVLAYMPGAVLQTIHNTADPTQDYSNSQYSHNFFVDATPEADDLFYGGTWHTWLVGGLGAGGAAIYALDITNPSNFSEANAGTLVMGEWSSSTISCINVASCGSNMGNTYGTPIIRRLHDGNWAIIFGNGFGSTSGDAGIFVMLIDSSGATHASTTYYLSTGKAGTSDGIAYVASADLDSDHITDYVYAGDLLGNVWRFDLTSGTESAWAASSSALFTTPSGQPITTKVAVVGLPQTSGGQRLMVEFGTGRRIPQTNIVPASYATGTQSLYGIWDWNMASWNSKSSTQYASLSSGLATVANLTSQTLTVNADTSLDITSNTICWSGSTTCTGGTSGNTKFGWVVALPGTQEQVVYNPLVYQNALILNTTVPATNSPTSCQVTHDTGNTIALALGTGGALGTSTGGSFFKNTTDTNAAGSLTNGTGTPAILQAGGNTFMMTQSLGDGSFNPTTGTGAGPLTCAGPFCQANIKGAAVKTQRLTWVERR